MFVLKYDTQHALVYDLTEIYKWRQKDAKSVKIMKVRLIFGVGEEEMCFPPTPTVGSYKSVLPYVYIFQNVKR